MSEMCAMMRLVPPDREDPDVFLWACTDSPFPSFVDGTLILEPNWGRLIPSEQLSEADINQLARTDN